MASKVQLDKVESVWKPVKGKNFTSYELARFTEAKFITFLRFCEQFMVPSPDGPKYSNTPTLWKKAEEVLTMPDHPFQEYLYRINFFSDDPKASYRKFFAKLLSLMGMVLKYLQKNPALVTDEIRAILQLYPMFARALKQTAIVTTAIGADVVVQKQNVASYEEQLYSAAVKTTNLLEKLVDSISDKDIMKMKPRDKMIAIGRLGYLFTIAKNIRPNRQIFTQININATGREDLEKALLSMNKHE